jgi:hypothetical protein
MQPTANKEDVDYDDDEDSSTTRRLELPRSDLSVLTSVV